MDLAFVFLLIYTCIVLTRAAENTKMTRLHSLKHTPDFCTVNHLYSLQATVRNRCSKQGIPDSACRIFTHADGSRVSIAIVRLCDSVCPYDKTKTDTKIAKLGTEIVHHDTSPSN